MRTIYKVASVITVVSLFTPIFTSATVILPNFPAVGNIDTIVGGSGIDPRGLALCENGTKMYIADGQNNRIMVTNMTTGLTTLFAGTGVAGYGGDGGPALNAQFDFPSDVVCDPAGNVYIADTGQSVDYAGNRVRKIDARGIITTFAGNGKPGVGSLIEGDLATNAAVWNPRGLTFDTQGNLYVAEFTGNKIRKITPDGRIYTVAGTGSGGDGSVATQAALSNPTGIAIDYAGNVFISDYSSNRIRKVDANTHIISTAVGNGYQGYQGDGGPISGAQLKSPSRINFDSNGNLIVVDSGNNVVRRIEAVGGNIISQSRITTIAGNAAKASGGDGGLATSAQLFNPVSLTLGSDNTVYVGTVENTVPSFNNRIRRFTIGGTISSFLGGTNGDGGPAINAIITPAGSTVSTASGRSVLYIAEGANNRVRSVDLQTGIISTVAGSGERGFQDGPAASAKFNTPLAVAVDKVGNVFIADTIGNRVHKVSAGTNNVSTVLGDGNFTSSGDGGAAGNASVGYPYGLAFDSAGNLYVAEFGFNRIRKIDAGSNGLIDASDIVTTFVGTGNTLSSADGTSIATANLNAPTDVAVSPTDGMLYIADYNHHAVWRVHNGTLELIAGLPGTQGSSPDGVPAYNSKINAPNRLAFDSVGNLYISSAGDYTIKKVVATNGVITHGLNGSIMNTVTGTRVSAYSGDGKVATAAAINKGDGLSVDANNHLYISQSDAAKVRVITLPGGTVTSPPTAGTVSGTVTYYADSSVQVPNVTVTLTKTSGTPLTLMTKTDASGNFTLTNVPTGDWTVSYHRVVSDSESLPVSAIDAVAALQATAGIIRVGSTQTKACDVNASGSLSAIDASFILQYRVGVIQYLPASNNNVDAWGFDTPTTSFTLSSGSSQNLSASAYYVGDCDGSWHG